MPPRRRGRGRFSATPRRTATPVQLKADPEDEEMVDALDTPQQQEDIEQDRDAEGEPDEVAAANSDSHDYEQEDPDEAQLEDGDEEEEQGDADGEEEEEEEEEEGDGDGEDNAATPSELDDTQASPRKRQQGRPPRTKPPDWGEPDAPGEEPYSVGTPRRGRGRGRGGWRGGFRGFRGRGRGRGSAAVAMQQSTRQVVDKDGNIADVVDDEVVLPEDPEGETKVDKLGVLSGGREYRVRTFKVAGRGDRMYMLSTEPARCTGFRDSYLFFNKHLQLYKVILNDEEKRDLIDRDIIPHSYKGRSIGVVTARSVYREFGSVIIIGGKRIIDDYYVAEARARGDVEGELAVPEDKPATETKSYNKNQYVAWHGASSVYHNNAPSVPMPLGKPGALGKRRAPLNRANWMFEHARAASMFNSQLVVGRRATLEGVYDAHTNVMCYPGIMQPTHARWEFVPQEPTTSRKRKLDSLNDGDSAVITNGSNPSDLPAHAVEVDGVTIVDNALLPQEPTTVPIPETTVIAPPLTALSPPSSLLTRNYLVVDTAMETAPHASLPIPGPEEPETTALYPGSGRLPDLDEDDLALLPPECRDAFLQAKGEEKQWRNRFGDQERDGWRGEMRIGVGVLGI